MADGGLTLKDWRIEGIYVTSDPFPTFYEDVESWKRTGKGHLEKEYERTLSRKGSNSGGAEGRRRDKRPLEDPREQAGTYNLRGSISVWQGTHRDKRFYRIGWKTERFSVNGKRRGAVERGRKRTNPKTGGRGQHLQPDCKTWWNNTPCSDINPAHGNPQQQTQAIQRQTSKHELIKLIQRSLPIIMWETISRYPFFPPLELRTNGSSLVIIDPQTVALRFFF